MRPLTPNQICRASVLLNTLRRPYATPHSNHSPTASPSMSEHIQAPVRKNVRFSSIDRSWGELFYEDGKPTPRLGDISRGLANYIVMLSHQRSDHFADK
jgi:hypothetical protein